MTKNNCELVVVGSGVSVEAIREVMAEKSIDVIIVDQPPKMKIRDYPISALPKVIMGTPPSGQEKRRERRKQNRKNH